MRGEAFLGALREVLEGWPGAAGRRLVVALSGGLDSSVLLVALRRLHAPAALRAIHVDHAIHPDSRAWEARCRGLAAQLGVAYESRRVTVDVCSPMGLEAAAREARYAAFRELLGEGELLLTAHHADDQLETVLLRLLRGTGARGLQGIVELAPFGRGLLGRPLLGFTREALAAVAEEWGLEWVEDPSNSDVRHDRNYLRAMVLPRLRERWPRAPQTVGRLARLMHDAEEILADVAAADAASVVDERGRITCAALLALPASRQRNLLRALVRQKGLPTLQAKHLREVLHAASAARGEAQPLVRWPGGEARGYRGRLYLGPPLPALPDERPPVIVGRGGWHGPEGTVRFEPAGEGGLPDAWLEAGLTLRFRVGGERIKPAGRAHSTPLKSLFQQAGIVPWMRPRVPLLFHGDHLAAVADLWLSAEAVAAPSERRWKVVFQDHPPLQ